MGIVISLAERRAQRPVLRVVEPTLEQRLRASLTPAPSDWQGRRVLVRALMLTGRVEGWCAAIGKLGVVYDTGESGFHDASTLDRLPNDPGAA